MGTKRWETKYFSKFPNCVNKRIVFQVLTLLVRKKGNVHLKSPITKHPQKLFRSIF